MVTGNLPLANGVPRKLKGKYRAINVNGIKQSVRYTSDVSRSIAVNNNLCTLAVLIRRMRSGQKAGLTSSACEIEK